MGKGIATHVFFDVGAHDVADLSHVELSNYLNYAQCEVKSGYF